MTLTDKTTSSASLFRINPTTATSTRIGPLGVNISGEGDIAFSPAGVLYAIESNGNLYTVSLITGKASLVGTVPPGNGTGPSDYSYLTFNSFNGNLYAIDDSANGSYTELVQITAGTAASPVAALSTKLGNLGGMTFDPLSSPATPLAYVADSGNFTIPPR